MFTKLRSLSVLFVVLPVAGCVTQAPEWQYHPEKNNTGRIYYYERSNVDGSMDERITIFHKDETNIEVYKENGLCQNAALVTAQMDWGQLSAPIITGGQLQPDAEHVEFAFLTQDKSAQKLDIVVKFPDGNELREEAPIQSSPWHLYDFDFASLTVATPHLGNPKNGFSFGMALVWADPSAGDPLVWMGDVQATYVGAEDHLGTPSLKYSLSGTAFSGDRAVGDKGALWLDEMDGHIVDVNMPVPNHPGYTDFRLKLLSVSDGGAAEWDALLHAHFENCG